MKATEACKIIGYALEDANREGKIQVFADLSDCAAPQVSKLQDQLTSLRRDNLAIQKENKSLQSRLDTVSRSVARLQLATAGIRKRARVRPASSNFSAHR